MQSACNTDLKKRNATVASHCYIAGGLQWNDDDKKKNHYNIYDTRHKSVACKKKLRIAWCYWKITLVKSTWELLNIIDNAEYINCTF